MTWAKLILQLTWRSILNPKIGIALLTIGWRMRRRGWQYRAPFLPVPDPDYLHWRMHTAFGAKDFVPPPQLLIQFARWATFD